MGIRNDGLPDGCSLLYDPPASVLNQIYRLRVRAWQARTNAFPDMTEWRDADDADALHWAIMFGDAPVAAARMTVHARVTDLPNAEIYAGLVPEALPGPIASINRLVVDAAWAGRGLPRVLDQVRIEEAVRRGCRHILGETYAGTRRIAGMEALGFAIIGETKPYRSGPLAMVKANRGGGEIAYLRRLC